METTDRDTLRRLVVTMGRETMAVAPGFWSAHKEAMRILGPLTPAQIREDAAWHNDQGNVEHAWYLYGRADKAEGLDSDPAQAGDCLYGKHYRLGYAGAP
jgi:hypothetical protein